MLRRVHRERVMALERPAGTPDAGRASAGGGRAAGTFQRRWRSPTSGLARTAKVMHTIGFGSRAEADRVTRQVRAMHRRVRGRLREAGRPLSRRDRIQGRRSRAAPVGAVLAGRLRPGGLPGLRRGTTRRRGGETIGRTTGWWGVVRPAPGRGMPRTLDDLDEYRRSMLDGDTLYVTPGRASAHGRS